MKKYRDDLFILMIFSLYFFLGLKMCQVFLVQVKPLTNTTMSISFVFTFEYIT